jgi:hypothetical protein
VYFEEDKVMRVERGAPPASQLANAEAKQGQ